MSHNISIRCYELYTGLILEQWVRGGPGYIGGKLPGKIYENTAWTLYKSDNKYNGLIISEDIAVKLLKSVGYTISTKKVGIIKIDMIIVGNCDDIDKGLLPPYWLTYQPVLIKPLSLDPK